MAAMCPEEPHRLDYASLARPARRRLIGARRLALGVLIGMMHWFLGLGLLLFFDGIRARRVLHRFFVYPVGWLVPERDWLGLFDTTFLNSMCWGMLIAYGLALVVNRRGR
jgi:hypothetical protein